MSSLSIFKINAPFSTSFSELGLFLSGIEGFKVLIQGGGADKPLLLRNKELVAGFVGMGINAIGLTGADLGIGQKNPGNDSRVNINPGPVFSLLRQEVLPVFAPYGFDQSGQLVHFEGDMFALDLAIALSSFADTKLILEESDALESPGLIRELEKEALENGVREVVQKGGLARLLKNSCSNISRTKG